jgi:DNA-binding LacI/PurR family transcriptional regulator
MATLQVRPTLRDIGLKTGFHYSTVSMALRDHPRISESTKQIIREAAEGLGYQPDAMLSSLCAYRLTKRPPKENAIVTRLPEVIRSLRRAGYRVPDDVGVAYHTLDEKSLCLSGMKKNSFQIGEMAVDLLIDMLHRNERGVPIHPYLLMVEGSWVEGNTLRSAPASTSVASTFVSI